LLKEDYSQGEFREACKSYIEKFGGLKTFKHLSGAAEHSLE